MGRSTASCFKIIACGGSTESVDRDDLDTSNENKGSDKRGWSFRKRSARHRVLSNTIVTEAAISENKQSSGPGAVNSDAPVNATVSEKSSGVQWIEEKPRLSTSTTSATVSTVVTKASCKDDIKFDPNPNDDDVKLDSNPNEDDVKLDSNPNEDDLKLDSNPNEDDLKLDPNPNEDDINLLSNPNEDDVELDLNPNEDDVKLDLNPKEADIKHVSNPDESVVILIQAAVRRFLAKRELLRHKKVVKLQAAVRGHLVRNHAVGTLRCVQAIVKMQALVRARRANPSSERSSVGKKGVHDAQTKSHPTYVSIEKLLSNRFARQLLDSTPRTKQINIKCDPSGSDSAWKWLERWMSASSPGAVQSLSPTQEKDRVGNTENQVESMISSPCESTDVKSDVAEMQAPSERKENTFKSEQNPYATSLDGENPQPGKTYTPKSEKCDFQLDEVRELDTGAKIEVNSVPAKPVSENEPKRSAKRLATEQADSDGRKSVFGAKKSSNPAFIAAQSKFKELSSKSNSSKPVSSSNKDVVLDSPADNGSSVLENVIPVRDVEMLVPNGGSECGTELSVTSTLDSPDQSEACNKEFEKETTVVDEAGGDKKRSGNLDVKEHAFLGTELTHPISIMPEKHEIADGVKSDRSKPANTVSTSQVEQKPDENASNEDIELEPETGLQIHKSNSHIEVEPDMGHQADTISAQASPRSHITVPESQGTPSSQVSTNNKKSRSDKKVSSQKRKSWSSSKKSPVSSSLDSGLRRSLDNLPKDAKRRNSFGSPRSDHEPRDGSNSNSIPSYMQATESARAKALANSSPRSSPDVQDKETYLKKRHSLPGAVNGRHGSPRIQRSMSQAQQSTKGNGSQERKWQR